MTEADKIELLANEVPALTFATGHKGVKVVDIDKNIDIRERFLKIPKAQWPEQRTLYEWRHSDLYLVGYPYVFRLYDYWSDLIQGTNP